jgi:hypothetical protein
MAKEAAGPLINVPCRLGLDPSTGDAIPIAYAVRKKGGDKDASEEEGRKEGRQEEVVGRRTGGEGPKVPRSRPAAPGGREPGAKKAKQ